MALCNETSSIIPIRQKLLQICSVHYVGDCLQQELKVHVSIAVSFYPQFFLFPFRVHCMLKRWLPMRYFGLLL